MAEKETITFSKPCVICGKPDWCYRLHFDNGNTLHCCARVDDTTTFANGVEYVQIKSKETEIGTYYYYQDKEVYDAFLSEHKKKPSYNKKGSSEKKNVSYTPREVAGECKIADSDKLDAVYRELLSLLTLEETDYMSLCKDYNTDYTGKDFVKKVLLSNYPIKSLPPEDWVRQLNRKLVYTSPFRDDVCRKLTEKFGSICDVPGFTEDDTGKTQLKGAEGVLFPIYDIQGRIIRLRVREKYPVIAGEYKGKPGNFRHGYSKKNGQPYWSFNDEDNNSELVWYPGRTDSIELKSDGCPKGKASGKYKNLSGVKEKDGANIYGKGCRSKSVASLYLSGAKDFSTVYVTEGEKKAMIISLLLGIPAISLPGVGTFGKLVNTQGDPGYDSSGDILPYLKTKGLKNTVIAYDADKGVNINVLKAEKNAVLRLKESGYVLFISEWSDPFGKGVDDALVKGIRPKVFLCA